MTLVTLEKRKILKSKCRIKQELVEEKKEKEEEKEEEEEEES